MSRSAFISPGPLTGPLTQTALRLPDTQPAAPFTIRPMLLEDVEQVSAIDRASFSMPWSERSYRYEVLENPHSLLLVAEQQHSDGSRIVVGSIVIWLIVDEAHIATISVHPDFRRLGIARELLAAALIESIQLGANTATLEVRAGNSIALALYRRFHFEVAGLRPRYYQDNHEDALIMTAVNLDNQYLTWLETEGWKNEPGSSEQEEVPS